MSNEITRAGLADRFWETKPMDKLNKPEWEALCDGCGKCCVNKLEDEDTGVVVMTRVACRLLDDESCLCSNYPNRHQFVPECIVLTPKTIQETMYWLPQTCAYRLIYEGRPLYDWHPLITGDSESVHRAGVSVKGMTVPEFEVDEDDWEDHVIEEPT
ncbi:YcgN family cysteine cluster protein [Yoonia maritima]|uniref:YcgN family cysteine cluster protein n=1 Tax=Yoonia maritima TaxID=1435347 RepID=UPI003735D7A7